MKISKVERDNLRRLNDAVHDAWDGITEAVARFNDAREMLHGAIDEIAVFLRSEWDEKSERWQESDRGASADEWIRDLETLSGSIDDEFEVDEPDWLANNEIADLATEPEG